VPLIDENGDLFGIYGIEISNETLSTLMKERLQLRHKEGFFVFGIIEDNVLLPDIYLTSLPYVYRHISDSMPIKFEEINLFGDTYQIRTTLNINGRQEVFYAAICKIPTYQSIMLNEGESWALIGFVHESEILTGYASSRNWILTPIAIALISGIGIFLFVSLSIIKQIADLSEYVRGFQGDRPLEFNKTNIYEIDELVTSISKLNNTVLESGNRLSTILDMTKLPIGCFEDKEKSSVVFVTPKLFEILGIDPSKYQESYMPKKEWDDIFFKILRGRNKSKTNVYKWEYENNPLIFKWLKLESSIIDDRNIGVIMDVTNDILKQEKLEFELDYDGMTRLLNRKSFKRICTEKISEFPNKIGAMIFADLDNLKYANDTYGHDTGDNYIIGAAEMFSAFKEIDGIVARMSGDEFAIYVHGFEDKDEAHAKIYEYIEQCKNKEIRLPDGTRMPIKSSIGIAWYGIDSKDLELLIKYSDYAMYETKLSTKGGVSEFDLLKYDKDGKLSEMKEALNKLIDEKLVRYVFQPIVDLRDGSICGYESLMTSTMDEFKSPFEVVSVATTQSKLQELEKLIIHTNLEWVAENKNLLGSKKVFINTFSNQVLASEDFEKVIESMAEFSDNVVYEITQSGSVDSKDLVKKLSVIDGKLKSVLDLNNFEVGYISEVIILSLHPDMIRLGADLVSGIFMDIDKQRRVQSLMAYCREKNIKVIAEGIEVEQELGFLIELGVDMAQGHYFGTPSFELQENIAKEQQDKIKSIKRLKPKG